MSYQTPFGHQDDFGRHEVSPPEPQPPSSQPPSSQSPSSQSPPNRPSQPGRPAGFPWSSLIWGVVFLVTLMSSPLILPPLVERVSFALRHGPERAAAEASRQVLNDLDIKDLSKVFHLVPKAISPSVVHINVSHNTGVGPDDEIAEFFGRRSPHESTGQGSGVIVDAEGYILTNYHVIAGASQVEVHLSDGQKYQATVVGRDALTDLAVLKIDAKGLVAAPWGNSEELQRGSLVWAAGSPFGLDHSITFGIISAKGRDHITRDPQQSFLQHDAAVNPGNSGGPLVNYKGEIIGINTAIIGKSFQGVSLAIPSSIAKRVYQQLRERGEIVRGWLGVGLVTERELERTNLPQPEGVLISQVFRPSPAWTAGVRTGDELIEWDGKTIDSSTALSRSVAKTEVGSTVKAVVIRGGEKLTLEVVVGRRPAELNR